MSVKFPGLEEVKVVADKVKTDSYEEHSLISDNFISSIKTASLDKIISDNILSIIKLSKEIEYAHNERIKRKILNLSQLKWEEDKKTGLDPMLDPNNLPKVHVSAKREIESDPNVRTFQKLNSEINRLIKLLTTTLV